MLANTIQNLSSKNYLNANFQQWAETLNQIYGERNTSRSPSEMWLRAVSDASKVGEAVRKMDAYEAMFFMTHAFGWVITTSTKLLNTRYDGKPALLTFDNKPHESLTEIILSKFPEICPYCGKDLCHCPSIRKTVERETKIERRSRLIRIRQNAEHNGQLPSSIAEIATMFESIYGQVHYGASLERITFHFLEEIGEVAWCITSLDDGTKRNVDTVLLNVQLAEEIADVVGWGFAVISKLTSLAKDSRRLASIFDINENSNFDYLASTDTLESSLVLPKWLWYEFYNSGKNVFECHLCKSTPCEC